MVKVLYYDYDYKSDNRKNLKKMLESAEDIDCVSFTKEPPDFKYPFKEIDEKLKSQDIYLTHPGILTQNLHLVIYPKKFPNLEIVLLTEWDEHYHSKKRNITIINYSEPEEILKYCEKKRKKSK